MKPRHLVASLTLTAALLSPIAQAGDTPARDLGWWAWLETTVRELIWGGEDEDLEAARWDKEGPTWDPFGRPTPPPPGQPPGGN
jgi:hypothetical protein